MLSCETDWAFISGLEWILEHLICASVCPIPSGRTTCPACGLGFLGMPGSWQDLCGAQLLGGLCSGECLAAARVMKLGSVCLLHPQPCGEEEPVRSSESSRSGQQQGQFGCYWAGLPFSHAEGLEDWRMGRRKVLSPLAGLRQCWLMVIQTTRLDS